MITLGGKKMEKQLKDKGVIIGIAILLVFATFLPLTNAQILRQPQSYKSVDEHITRDETYTLTLTTSGTGTGTIEATPGPYYNGSTVTIWANASTGPTFTGFTGNLTGTTTPQTLIVDSNKTVDAQFTPQEGYTLTIVLQGSGTVLKDPDLELYTYGRVVNLTAVPSPGWAFNHWEENLTGNTNPTNITMTENTTVIANFTQNQYTLTITIEGQGNVTKDPDQDTYTYGQNVNLTAIPDTGWNFDHWAGNLTGPLNPTTITIEGNTSLIANFTITSGYTLTISIEGLGNVTRDPDQTNYSFGQVVTLTAIPDTGWNFDHWTGDLTGSVNPTTITIDGNTSVIANFTQIQYTLTITIEGQGNVRKDPDQPWYSYGQLVTLTAIAAPHWMFNDWSGDLTGTQNPATITIDGNKSVIANFTFTNTPPMANDDHYSTLNDIPLFVAAPGVLGNDFDSDGDPLTAVMVNGTQGTLHLSANGSFEYQPPLSYHGMDVFTYQAFDGITYSNIATVTISVINETAPNKPITPTGPAVGKSGIEYTFNVTTTDPDDDQVYYQWSWGDGNISDWLGPFASGETATASHVWYSQGIYQIKVKAKDSYNFTTNWSDPLAISILQPTVLIGLISNVTSSGEYLTFEPQLTLAVTLPQITFPITGPGHMMILKKYLGFAGKRLIIGYFYAVWIPDQ